MMTDTAAKKAFHDALAGLNQQGADSGIRWRHDAKGRSYRTRGSDAGLLLGAKSGREYLSGLDRFNSDYPVKCTEVQEGDKVIFIESQQSVDACSSRRGMAPTARKTVYRLVYGTVIEPVQVLPAIGDNPAHFAPRVRFDDGLEHNAGTDVLNMMPRWCWRALRPGEVDPGA